MKRLLSALVLVGLAAALLLAPLSVLADFGIDPGKVYVDNLYPGAQAEYSITVYNRGDRDESYRVRPRTPDYTDPEYESFPYLDWITVTPEELPVVGGGDAAVTVVVIMPADADYAGKNAEAWISFTVLGDEAMVQIELASRLFISTEPAEDGQADVTVDGQEAAKNDDGDGLGYAWVFPVATLVAVAVFGFFYFYVRRKGKSR